MAEEQTPNPQADAGIEPDSQSSAGTENTRGESEHRIPEARFKQVLDERNELKARLERLEKQADERRKAEMSESERAKADAEEARQKANQLQQQLDAERRERLNDRRKTYVANALAAAQAVDADETVDWLEKHHADELQAALTADGMADPDQIKALVQLARAERPHHFRPGGVGSPSNAGGNPPAANMDAETVAAQQFLEQYGYRPNKERLATFMHEARDSQVSSKRG